MIQYNYRDNCYRRTNYGRKQNIKDKLENLKEGHRKSNKDIIESLFAILGYLKNNTDVDNPTSQTQMRKVEEISEYLGTKSTFHNKW